VMFFFQDRVLWTICQGWLWTTVFLISASWVARIAGMSHQCPAIALLFWVRGQKAPSLATLRVWWLRSIGGGAAGSVVELSVSLNIAGRGPQWTARDCICSIICSWSFFGFFPHLAF
jgi:hypothetical protein